MKSGKRYVAEEIVPIHLALLGFERRQLDDGTPYLFRERDGIVETIGLPEVERGVRMVTVDQTTPRDTSGMVIVDEEPDDQGV